VGSKHTDRVATRLATDAWLPSVLPPKNFFSMYFELF
jgi:hypothetical protein